MFCNKCGHVLPMGATLCSKCGTIGGIKVMKNALFQGGILTLSTLDWLSAVKFLVSIFVIRKLKLNPVAVIIGGGVAGGLIRLIFGL